MVGIVLVSHSRALATALQAMVRQVATDQVPLAISAGVGEERQELGTDAVEVAEAIQSVYGPDGVLVLMDLGSAVLSAEMARDLLPPEVGEKVRFCSAPIVEGAVAAVVQAGLGSDLDTICQEASGALLPKQQQIGDLPSAAPPSAIETPVQAGAAAEEVILTLKNAHGLHARPAARFVQMAAGFDAQIQVSDLTNNRGPVSAKSINALATLGAIRDHRLRVAASGAQAPQALQALAQLVEDNFGESEIEQVVTPAAVVEPEDRTALTAIPIAEGIAIGPLYRYQAAPPPIPTGAAEDSEQELERLQQAQAKVRQEIQARRRQVAANLGEGQAGIFDAHLLLLEDPDLLEQVQLLIRNERKNAAAAWHEAISAVARSYRSVDDIYIQQRAADVEDVGNQVLHALAGEASAAPARFPQPVILLAEELTPTQISQLNMDQVLGIVTLLGGPTSHSAILARSLGIPSVTGAPATLLRAPDGARLALDGSRGLLWLDPPTGTQEELNARREEWLNRRRSLLQTSHQRAITRDERVIEVVANIGSLQEAEAAMRNGAEGVGILRTEFLFLDRRNPPGEDEQASVLEQIGKALQGQPVIVRTLDAGGDKPMPYLEANPEANPFLGVRGLRLSLRNPDLFTTQLRAILRAGAAANLRIMFPMVSNLDEVQRAKEMVEAAHNALQSEGVPHCWPVQTGIMVEVPAVALIAPILAPHVDFFSVGTNDLTQYTLAAERGNPNLAEFADAIHPAVLRLIQQVVAAGHQYGKWVGVCGEVAGDPAAAAPLVGLGVDELSLNPAGIPRIKATVRSFSYSEAQALAEKILAADSAKASRQLAVEFLQNKEKS